MYSKDEIYAKFPVAVKFVLENRDGPANKYEKLFEQLATECRFKLTAFPHTIKNFHAEHPVSAGLFVELDEPGDTGKPMGSDFILLEHESGWEAFLHSAEDAIIGAAVLAVVKPLFRFIRTSWSKWMHGGIRISHVEIRTEHKGVMCIKFSEFEYQHLACLLNRFHTIQKHLTELNKECFGGKFHDCRQKATAVTPQADD